MAKFRIFEETEVEEENNQDELDEEEMAWAYGDEDPWETYREDVEI